MNRFLRKAAQSLREAFTADVETARHLEKTYVDVTMRSRLWGV
jgi:hypothetical protein